MLKTTSPLRSRYGLAAIALNALLLSGNAQAYDLEARFTMPTSATQELNKRFVLKVDFRNIGDGSTPRTTVKVYRYRVQANGQANRHGTLLPPQQGRLMSAISHKLPKYHTWNDTCKVPGTYVYKVTYTPDVNDVNNANHKISKRITCKGILNTGDRSKPTQPAKPVRPVSGLPDGATVRAGIPDLEAKFISPTGNRYPEKMPRKISVHFKNINKGKTKANRIQLSAHRVGRGGVDGYGYTLGKPQTLKELGQGKFQVLNFTDSNPVGTVEYRIKYSSPQNDINNNNHKRTKQITYYKP